MAVAKKRATVYLDAKLHKAVRIKSIETSRSVSPLANEAVTLALAEDAEDAAAFDERSHEPLITFEAALARMGKPNSPARRRLRQAFGRKGR